MNAVLKTEQITESLAQVYRHWEETRNARHAAPRFTVAIARQAGTPAREIAQALASKLNWPVYDRELVEKIAQEMGLQASLLEAVDEKRVNWMVQNMQYLLSVPHANEMSFLRHLVKTLLALGMHGNCIIIGRGSPHVLPPQTTLRVRLVAPMAQRIACLAKRLEVSHDEAARRIEATDRQRADFIRNYFLTEVNDADKYDLVLNTAQFSPEACAQLMLDGLKQRQNAEAPALAPVYAAQS